MLLIKINVFYRRNICFVLTSLQACKIQSAAKPASSRWRAVDLLSARHWSNCGFLSIQKVSGEAQEAADLFTSFCSVWCMHGDRWWCPHPNYIWYAFHLLVSSLRLAMRYISTPVTSNVVPNAVLSAISGLQDPATSGLADGMHRFYFFYYCLLFRETHCYKFRALILRRCSI